MANSKKKRLLEPLVEVSKPVSSRSAQYIALCDNGISREDAVLANMIEKFLANNKNQVIVFIVGLLYCYGLRISEVLSLSAANVIGNYQLLVKGAKGSNDRIVTVIFGKEFYNTFKLNQFSLGAVYSRFWVYRELRKAGIYAFFGENRHMSVTHLSRHLKVLDLKAKGVSRETISQFIGHRNLETLKYYESKQKTRRKKS